MFRFSKSWQHRLGWILSAACVAALAMAIVPASLKGLQTAESAPAEESLPLSGPESVAPSSIPEVVSSQLESRLESEPPSSAPEETPSSSAPEQSEPPKKEPAAPIVKDIEGSAKPIAPPKQNATKPVIKPPEKNPSKPESKPESKPTPAPSVGIQLKIPYVSQLPSYPTGCEAASAAMLLRYYGYSVSLSDMVKAIPREDLYKENGKVYGPDITEAFVGDPTQTYTNPRPGYGVFSPALTRSIQKMVDARGGKQLVQNISGCSFDDMLKILDSGHPIIVWATYRMKVPTQVNAWYIKNGDGTDRYFEYPRGTHVMILSGYDGSTVTTVDPYGNGVLKFSRQTFYDRWVLLGKQAIVMNTNKSTVPEEPSSSVEPSQPPSSSEISSQPPSSSESQPEPPSSSESASVPAESSQVPPEESSSTASESDSHRPARE